MGPPPKKGKGLLIGVIVAVVVIVVVLLVLFLFVFKGGTELVGKWNINSVEYSGISIDLPSGSYIEFKDDGKVTMSMDMCMGFGAVTSTGTYEDQGGGKVKITMDGASETADYSVSGSTLSITIEGMTMTCTKA
jgi:hypothetical protein